MKFTYFSMLIATLVTSINVFAEDKWGYKGPLGAITYCDNTIGTKVLNFTPNPITVLSVDGGREFIATKNKLNMLGTKKTNTGIIDPQGVGKRPTVMKVFEIAKDCIDQPKNNSKTVDFNIHILLPEIGEVILSEKVLYKENQARIEAFAITSGENNSADKKKHVSWQKDLRSSWSRSLESQTARFVKGDEEYIITFEMLDTSGDIFNKRTFGYFIIRHKKTEWSND